MARRTGLMGVGGKIKAARAASIELHTHTQTLAISIFPPNIYKMRRATNGEQAVKENGTFTQGLIVL